LGVGFGGGEPTLYPFIGELCDFCAGETSLAVTLTTHAHRFSDQLVERLAGSLHFVRVSMDGIGPIYESIRRRSFQGLLDRIRAIQRITAFGVNYGVNSRTVQDLDKAAQLACDLGASQFLLLPEVRAGRASGIDNESMQSLRDWVNTYQGSMHLAISAAAGDGLPVCDPLPNEKELRAFAHIDASGILKRTSFDNSGVEIQKSNVMDAIAELKTRDEEGMK